MACSGVLFILFILFGVCQAFLVVLSRSIGLSYTCIVMKFLQPVVGVSAHQVYLTDVNSHSLTC